MNKNNASIHLQLQSQCSRILGLVLSLCSHTTRECSIGTNLSLTGMSLSSSQNNKIKHHNEINFDKYSTCTDLIENFYYLNSNLFHNINVRVTGNKKNDPNNIDYHSILDLFSQKKSLTSNDNNSSLRSMNRESNNKNNSRLDLYELENIGNQNNTVLLEQYFTDPLKDPYLSVAIKNICKLFTNMEKLFLLSPTFNVLHYNMNNANNESVHAMINIQNQNANNLNLIQRKSSFQQKAIKNGSTVISKTEKVSDYSSSYDKNLSEVKKKVRSFFI